VIDHALVGIGLLGDVVDTRTAQAEAREFTLGGGEDALLGRLGVTGARRLPVLRRR
jgi:hypothetical protein